jgi:hypothetical protein
MTNLPRAVENNKESKGRLAKPRQLPLAGFLFSILAHRHLQVLRLAKHGRGGAAPVTNSDNFSDGGVSVVVSHYPRQGSNL